MNNVQYLRNYYLEVMYFLTVGICSEKCVIRKFRCANYNECIDTKKMPVGAVILEDCCICALQYRLKCRYVAPGFI